METQREHIKLSMEHYAFTGVGRICRDPIVDAIAIATGNSMLSQLRIRRPESIRPIEEYIREYYVTQK